MGYIFLYPYPRIVISPPYMRKSYIYILFLKKIISCFFLHVFVNLWSSVLSDYPEGKNFHLRVIRVFFDFGSPERARRLFFIFLLFDSLLFNRE